MISSNIDCNTVRIKRNLTRVCVDYVNGDFMAERSLTVGNLRCESFVI